MPSPSSPVSSSSSSRCCSALGSTDFVFFPGEFSVRHNFSSSAIRLLEIRLQPWTEFQLDDGVVRRADTEERPALRPASTPGLRSRKSLAIWLRPQSFLIVFWESRARDTFRFGPFFRTPSRAPGSAKDQQCALPFRRKQGAFRFACSFVAWPDRCGHFGSLHLSVVTSRVSPALGKVPQLFRSFNTRDRRIYHAHYS